MALQYMRDIRDNSILSIERDPRQQKHDQSVEEWTETSELCAPGATCRASRRARDRLLQSLDTRDPLESPRVRVEE